MTVPRSNEPLTSVSIVSLATSTKVHSLVRQIPALTSGQVNQEHSSVGDHNGRLSIQATSYEGGLLVGLYDPHLGPHCAEYLEQHLVPILDESLSTQLDHSDDDLHHTSVQNPNNCRIDPNQVIDTLKSTFQELDELLLTTAITVAMTQPEDPDIPEEEIKKTQEVIAGAVTGSTALVSFLAPHTSLSSSTSITTSSPAVSGSPTTEGGADDVSETKTMRHDFYLAQVGDSVAILAGFNYDGQWTVRRLNPPETHEHSVRYPGSEEYRKVVLEAKERGLTAEQFLSQHNGNHQKQQQQQGDSSSSSSTNLGAHDSFLTRGGKFLGLPVTRAFGDFDWKKEQNCRKSVVNVVEKSLRNRIDKALSGGQEAAAAAAADNGGSVLLQDEIKINNLHDPPYVTADPQISRFILETRKDSKNSTSHSASSVGSSDQLLILLSRGLMYTSSSSSQTGSTSSSSAEGTTEGVVDRVTGKRITNPYDHALMSDFELTRIVADTLDKGEENCAQAIVNVLDQKRCEARLAVHRQDESEENEGTEGSVVVVVL
ncbi:hypothetical protein BGX28_009216 [Mortierella sp. GBA30]|nr:hypothetical protein BGX28_009216 [Mortierella sp. GBA30]